MNSIAKVTVALCALLAWHTAFAQNVQPDPKVKLAQGTEGTAGTAGGTAGGTATGAATTATGAAVGGGFGVGALAISGAAAATIAATSSSGGTTTSHVPTVTHTP